MQLEEGQALLARVSRGHQGTLSGIFLKIIIKIKSFRRKYKKNKVVEIFLVQFQKRKGKLE